MVVSPYKGITVTYGRRLPALNVSGIVLRRSRLSLADYALVL